jgi:hypothetical protein
MSKLTFPKPHTQSTQVLATVKEALETPSLSTAQQHEKVDACLDQYLKAKADPQVFPKANTLLLDAISTFEPPVRHRFEDALMPAVERRRPEFSKARRLAAALDTETLATQRALVFAKERRLLEDEVQARVQTSIATAIHDQGIDDGMAFALANALGAEDLDTALAYYTSDAGIGFANKLPQLIDILRKSNMMRMGLLDAVLGTAMRPESPRRDPRLRKMQRVLAACPLTASESDLARKISAEAAAELFSEAEIDAALAYWQSPASQAVVDVCNRYNESLRPRLSEGEYAKAFARIIAEVDQN